VKEMNSVEVNEELEFVEHLRREAVEIGATATESIQSLVEKAADRVYQSEVAAQRAGCFCQVFSTNCLWRILHTPEGFILNALFLDGKHAGSRQRIGIHKVIKLKLMPDFRLELGEKWGKVLKGLW